MVAGAAHGQPDPLKSEACGMALQHLQQLVAAAAPRDPADLDKIALARGHAAQLCLGESSTQRERSGVPYRSEAVAPPTTAIARPNVPVAPSAPAPPLAVPRPPVITGCDAAGCWDSDGRRLNTMGPVLMGPRGPCIVQGAMVNCP
jgi:hypothetical protein